MSENQVLELLNSSERDLDWLDKNMDFLKENYDQKVVAIKQGKVVAVGTLMEDVLSTLKAQSIDTSETLIQFISKIPVIL